MKFLKILLILSFLGVITMGNTAAQSFYIKSNSFSNGQILPDNQVCNQFGCNGKNLSPHLEWGGAPEGTKSFAIIAHDPDAPRQTGWYHWIIVNIPRETRSLNEGQQINLPMTEIKNDFGYKEYGGACPPKGHGIHHYNFTVYALNVTKMEIDDATPADLVRKAIEQRALASATVSATYSRN